MFVILLTYRKPFEEVAHHLADHCAFLDRYYAAGSLLASGPQNPRTGGVILCRLQDREAVEVMLAEDPFRIHGIADYTLIEFTPTNFAKGLEEFL